MSVTTPCQLQGSAVTLLGWAADSCPLSMDGTPRRQATAADDRSKFPSNVRALKDVEKINNLLFGQVKARDILYPTQAGHLPRWVEYIYHVLKRHPQLLDEAVNYAYKIKVMCPE